MFKIVVLLHVKHIEYIFHDSALDIKYKILQNLN